MVSEPRVGKSSTATWGPRASSKARSLPSSASRSDGLSVPVWSVTRVTSLGTGMVSGDCASAAAAKTSAATPERRRPARLATLLARRGRGRHARCGGHRGLGREVDLRRFRDRLLVLDREAGLFLVAEHHRRQIGRELAREDVVFLHRLDEAVTRGGDAVLRALELRLQVAKERVALELRIVLHHHEQPRER